MRLAALSILGIAVANRPMSCNATAPEAHPITVTYEIPAGPGERTIELRGDCDGVSADGALSLAPFWGRCELVGARRDGLLEVESAPVPLDPTAPRQHIVFDDLPGGPIGGMGAYVREVAGGIRVSRVLPGHPASLAGLQANDWILAIDGRSTEGMSATEFVRAFAGPVGQSVALTIRRAGACPAEVQISRGHIE